MTAPTQTHTPPPATSFPLHKIQVVLLEGVHEKAGELLAAEGYTVNTRPDSPTDDELLELVSEAHLIGVRSRTKLTACVLREAKRLLGIGCFCIGSDQVDLCAAAEQGVAVFNAPFSNTRSVAEMTIAEAIALHRGLVEQSMKLHRGQWAKTATGRHEVRGRTIGIVGYGRIGSQVSVLAEAIGMRVLFYDITRQLPIGNAQSVGSLAELLERSDIVTLHVPAMEQTKGMIGAEQIGLMKPTSHLINNARGDVVDLEALRSALDTGRLAGAAVDVYPEEPASEDERFDCPLVGAPNVILTPHIGGSTEEAQRNIADEVATKLIKFINNGSTTTSINLPEVELPILRPTQHRILHIHHNVPGVLSRLHQMISELGVNISAEHLQSNQKIGYVILDVDPTHDADIKRGLNRIPETIRVRTLW